MYTRTLIYVSFSIQGDRKQKKLYLSESPRIVRDRQIKDEVVTRRRVGWTGVGNRKTFNHTSLVLRRLVFNFGTSK